MVFAAAFASCMQDYSEQVLDIPSGATPINIDDSINQISTTRADESGFCDGDGVGIYVVNYEN